MTIKIESLSDMQNKAIAEILESLEKLEKEEQTMVLNQVIYQLNLS